MSASVGDAFLPAPAAAAGSSEFGRREDPPFRPNSLIETLRIMPFLVRENLGFRVKTSRFGFVFAAAEPVIVILLSSLIPMLSGTLAPPIGRSFVLFFATAIIPFYTSIHVAWRFREWDMMTRLPSVSELQLALSHIISEILLKLVVILIVFSWVFFTESEEAIPTHPLLIIASLLLLIVFGVGMGMLNAVISSFIPIWSSVFFLLARAWLLLSGGMMIADNLPPTFRDAIAWVPLTHAIILCRMGQYPSYPHLILDVPYLVWTSFASLVIGWIVERSTREWRNLR